jgi:photosystem II stability/assembly factor-like uncharacterized protein
MAMLASLGLTVCALGAVVHHPHDIVNSIALSPDFPRDATVFCASAGSMNLFLVSQTGGLTWVNSRGGMRGWQVLDCAVAPDWATSHTAFAAVGMHGVQRTRNGGVSWDETLLDAEVNLVVQGPIEGARRTVFFAGGRNVWRSDDDGDDPVSILNAEHLVLALALSPDFARDGTLAVATRGKQVRMSSDGGATWRTTDLPGVGFGLEFSPRFAEDRTLWVASYLSGLLRSTDAGLTFERVAGLDEENLNDIAVAPTWPESRDLFVSTQEHGIFRSRDGGETWKACGLRVALSDQAWNHYGELALSPDYPRDPTLFCAAFEGLYISDDAGDNWYESNINPTHIGRAIELSPGFERDNHVFAQTYGNPSLVSTDRGDTWEMRSLGLEAMSTYSIGVSPQFQADGLVLVGVERGLRRSRDGGLTWDTLRLEPTGPTERGSYYEVREIVFSPDFATDRSIFAVSEAGVFFSADASDTWTHIAVPEQRPLRLALSPTWAQDRTLFAGGRNLRRSTDGGATWSEPLVSGEIVNVRCAPDFNSSGAAFAISRDLGLFSSRDHGATWQSSPQALDGFSPSKLRLSPDYGRDGTLWVSTLSGGIFRSEDRGATWDRLLPLGSPVDTCFDFALSPAFDRDGTALACTFEGILRTTDGGASWKRVTPEALYDTERDPWILRGGGWESSAEKRAFVFGEHRARAAGQSATLPFAGSAIALYGSRGPDHGLAEVLIDGETVATVDAYAPRFEPRATLFESQSLPPAFHDLTVRVLGRGSAASKGTWWAVDAALIRYLEGSEPGIPVLARLENIYLDLNANYGRDVLGNPRSSPGAGAPPRRIGTRALLVLLACAALIALWIRARSARVAPAR